MQNYIPYIGYSHNNLDANLFSVNLAVFIFDNWNAQLTFEYLITMGLDLLT